jgi:quercetin dioxygenase-like cupin family protein
MLSVNTITGLGDLSGAIYDFQFVGDTLERHVHNEMSNHITIVARGKLKAVSDNWEKEAIAGQIIDFKAGEPHELIALEENTRIINIVKKYGGQSNDYQKTI